MERVVSLDVAVIQTRTVPTGTRVGYGGAHITSRETRLATIAAGYADGLPRSLSGRGAVYYQGIRLPITGRVFQRQPLAAFFSRVRWARQISWTSLFSSAVRSPSHTRASSLMA